MSVAAQRLVPLQDLVLMPELSPRKGLAEETVIRYMESFESLPPVRVQRGSNVLVDGYHRVEAAVRLGLEHVPVDEEPIPDDELKMVAGLANTQHGQPLTRQERNSLAVALVRNYGKLREEVGQLLGMSASAVTLAVREHQFNEQLSEKLGSPVQVINSAHVRALYRVGPDQRERLLEAVVSKLDDDGQPYPLTGAELKLLVDRMLDPATPTAELNRLLSDPKARPKPPSSNGAAPHDNGAGNGLASDPFMPEPGSNTRPWEREWESPNKGGDGENFDRVRSVDEEFERQGVYAREKQIGELLERAEENAYERAKSVSEVGLSEGDYQPLWGKADALSGAQSEADRLREGVSAAMRALAELTPQIEPEDVRKQVEAVLALLESLS